MWKTTCVPVQRVRSVYIDSCRQKTPQDLLFALIWQLDKDTWKCMKKRTGSSRERWGWSTWPALEVKRMPSSTEERPRWAPASTSRRTTCFLFCFFKNENAFWYFGTYLKMTTLHGCHQGCLVKWVPHVYACSWNRSLCHCHFYGRSTEFSLCTNVSLIVC